MRVTPSLRAIVRGQREHRKMLADGYRMHETDWEIIRGGRCNEVIVDAVISHDGKHVYTKIGPKP